MTMLPEMRSGIIESLRRSLAYRDLRERGGGVERLPVAAASWVLGILSEDLGRPLLVVTPHEAQALWFVQGARLLDLDVDLFSFPTLTPYQAVAPSIAVRAREVELLDRLLTDPNRGIVATARALFRALPSRECFAAAVMVLETGQEIRPEEVAGRLAASGYSRRDVVTDLGEFAVRGGLIDCCPPGARSGLRIDFEGDCIDALRSFDVDDQRSTGSLAMAKIPPVTLFAHRDALRRVGESLAQQELGYEARRMAEAASRGEPFPGWENFLPVLAAERTMVVDWLGAESLVAVVEPAEVMAEIDRHAAALESDFDLRREEGRLAVPPARLEHSPERVRDVVAGAWIRLGALAGRADPDGVVDFAAAQTDLFHEQLPRFPAEVRAAIERGERTLVVTGAGDQRGRVERLCQHYSLPVGSRGVEWAEGRLERGFRLPAAGVVVFSEDQLFRRPPAAPRRKRARKSFFADLRDLRIGDFVVHEDHGIGQFVGLRMVGITEREGPELPPLLAPEAVGREEAVGEALEIRYRDDQLLLLPPSRLDLIQRYAAVEGSTPRLDRLGGTSWARARSRVRAGVRKLAVDLLELYAQRKLSEAARIPPDSDLLAQFEAAFEYEPTDDQLEAIADIKSDLESGRPMDRLLCGDVGFGKTEVAMRAAFKVVEGGYQVAVLAPTTILADQHYETFGERFAEFPVEIDMVSRFRSDAEIRRTAQLAAEGKVDILIGTHRVLSRDIKVPNLGLLIVDEEQRFGVAQKERLKEMKTNVHVLALTATPAPRTLQLSLAGVRDLSTIETPPRDRQAVETTIAPASDELIREAIEYEIDRGGQVYYVHNRVAGIAAAAERLSRLCPHVGIVVGHGQMEESELAKRMHSFKAGAHDVLVATTIIENGIDIPSVNTIIVHRADRFGLAQLYQLRGRVGRSSELAYCYLLVPRGETLSATSRRRLEAIREFTELGAGFRVAARDLEIRGAGDVLGAEQSGHITSVGIETYLKLLDETVRELKGEKVEEAVSTTIHLPIAATIPRGYISDTGIRIDLYRRIAEREEGENDLLGEIEDRFGRAPQPVRDLLAIAELRRLGESLRVQTISSRAGALQIRFRQDTRVTAEALVELVDVRPEASFSPTGVLTVEGVGEGELLCRAREVLETLAE